MSWDAIRSTLLWFLLLLIGAVAVGGAYAYHFWTRSDEFIDHAVRKKLAEIAPDWDIDFQSFQLTPEGRLDLLNVVVRPVSSNSPLARMPRVGVQLDRDLLLKHQRIVVRKVVLDEPEVLLIRTQNGEWNWHGARLPKPSDEGSPEWSIVDGRIRLRLEQPTGRPLEMEGENLRLTMLPEAYRRYRYRATGHFGPLGGLSVKGHFDGNTGEWFVAGAAGDIRATENLFNLAGVQLPDLGSEHRATDPNAPESSPGQAIRHASAAELHASSEAGSNAESRVRADVEVSFHLGQPGKGAPLDYLLEGSIRHGQISDAILPIPLYELRADLRIDPEQITIRNFSASNGEAKLFIDGSARQGEQEWTKDFVVRATNLQFDERIRPFLTTGLRKIYDMIEPAGTFDLDVSFIHEEGAPPRISLRQLNARNCRARHSHFRYPVHGIQGVVTQDGNSFHVDLHGIAGERPVTMRGVIEPAGPLTGVDLEVEATDFPLDADFLNAFAREDQQGIRSTLESLRMQGKANLHCRFVRRAGVREPVHMIVDASVHEARMNFVGFPYEVTELSGKVSHNPMESGAWVFTECQGKHGATSIRGSGRFEQTPEADDLVMKMAIVNLAIDQELRHAVVTENPDLELLWEGYELRGTLDIPEAEIHWDPGSPAEGALRGMQLKDGSVRPPSLPYRWDDVAGSLSWEDNRLVIHALHGWHGDSYLQIDGSSPDSAVIEIDAPGESTWRVHLDDVRLIKLLPDQELRAALPDELRRVLDNLELQGAIDLQLGLDLKGWEQPADTVTAKWRCLVSLNDNAFVAGLPLSEVTGRLAILNGEWNGLEASVEGYVEFDQARTLEMPFTNIRGPLKIVGNRGYLGIPAFAGPAPLFSERNPYRGRQVQADIYDGRTGISAEVHFDELDDERTQYRVDVKVEDVELATWAKDQLVEIRRLQGKVNSEMSISGQGTSVTNTVGEGWVQITPAQLYELPVFAQIFSLIKLRQPDNTAFTYAYGDFTIHDGLFDFSRIELMGDALSLVGRGTVGYAGPRESDVYLDFYSKMNNQVPFLRPVIERFGSRWVRVQVQGTVWNPIPRIQPRIPLLDEAFQGFMQTLEAGQMRPPPRGRAAPQRGVGTP